VAVALLVLLLLLLIRVLALALALARVLSLLKSASNQPLQMESRMACSWQMRVAQMRLTSTELQKPPLAHMTPAMWRTVMVVVVVVVSPLHLKCDEVDSFMSVVLASAWRLGLMLLVAVVVVQSRVQRTRLPLHPSGAPQCRSLVLSLLVVAVLV
jgi:hypothetical protein